MDKNSEDFYRAQRLAESPAGQQLLALLKASDSGLLEKAAAQANAGNFQQAGETLSSLLSSPEVRVLMEQLGRQDRG